MRLGKKKQLLIDEDDFNSGCVWVVNNLNNGTHPKYIESHIHGIKSKSHQMYKKFSESYLAGAQYTLYKNTEVVSGEFKVADSFKLNPPKIEVDSKTYVDGTNWIFTTYSRVVYPEESQLKIIKKEYKQ